jgi:hypothetical protein
MSRLPGLSAIVPAAGTDEAAPGSVVHGRFIQFRCFHEMRERNEMADDGAEPTRT